MARHITLIDRIMNEVIFYGGIPMRRYDVLRHAKKVLGTAKPFGAEYFAFHPKAIEGVEPWTLAEFEAQTGE